MGLALNTQLPNVSSIYYELQEIEHQLQTEPITWEKHEALIHQLDEVDQTLLLLEESAAHVDAFALSFLKELRGKAIFLYGETDDLYCSHEIHIIQQKTLDLEKAVKQGDCARIAHNIDSLKECINALLSQVSPLLSDRRMIVMARIMIEKAEAFLAGKGLEMDEATWSFLEAEEILEMLGELYSHQEDRKSLRLVFDRLTEAQKKVLLAYFDSQNLVPGLFHDVE